MPTETKWTLPTADGKTIYGLKNTADKPTEAAIFMVHGLGGHMYEYAFKRAADTFSVQGFDVFRFNLYEGQKGGRTLPECTLQTHADDLNTVLKEYAGTYQKVFVIGHSYGGPTVMLANPEGITAASLCDPSFNPKQVNLDFAEAKELKVDGYDTINWGTIILVGKPMVAHSNTLDEDACIQLSKDFNAPVQVVFAGDGYYVNQPINYHSHGKPENLPRNRSDIVEGTSHCFYEGDTCEELLAKTHAFFQSFR